MPPRAMFRNYDCSSECDIDINDICNNTFAWNLFQCGLSLIYLCTSDIYVLINYSSFVESCFIMLSVMSLLYLRWKQPDMERPIKVI